MTAAIPRRPGPEVWPASRERRPNAATQTVNALAVNLSQLTVTQISVAAGAFVVLVAYVVFIVVPAWGSYGRWWERFAASFMTLFILVTLVGVGAGIGAVLIYYWDRL